MIELQIQGTYGTESIEFMDGSPQYSWAQIVSDATTGHYITLNPRALDDVTTASKYPLSMKCVEAEGNSNLTLF